MHIEYFEEILAWKKAKELTLHIYKLNKSLNDFSYKDQIQRAAISIMNNIAEGFERKGNTEFVKFLYIAKGSCAEVRSMLYIGLSLQYYSEEQYKNLYNMCIEVSKMISGFIKVL